MHMRAFAQVNIQLPDLGEGTKEATIKEILVKVGQRVEEYEDLCEVFTDKLVAKIPSTASGVITAINYGDDSICQTGHTIMTIETDDGAVVEQEVKKPVKEETSQSCPLAAKVEAPKANQPVAHTGDKAISTPPVRKFAKDNGVNINLIKGTGNNGRVTR